MTGYFPDAKFSTANRSLFAFASYNAGPGRISQIRKEAAKRGLDPDKWFNNAEVVTAEKVGIETTTYVRNIYNDYAAYELMLDVRGRRGRRASRSRRPSLYKPAHLLFRRGPHRQPRQGAGDVHQPDARRHRQGPGAD